MPLERDRMTEFDKGMLVGTEGWCIPSWFEKDCRSMLQAERIDLGKT